jgi:hypothetical protein
MAAHPPLILILTASQSSRCQNEPENGPF